MTKLVVPAFKTLPADARHTGLMKLVKVTGEDSCNKEMSLLFVVLLNSGWMMNRDTPRDTSLLFGSCWVSRPRKTVTLDVLMGSPFLYERQQKQRLHSTGCLDR